MTIRRRFAVPGVVGIGLLLCGALWGFADSVEMRCSRGDGVACGVLADRERQAPRGERDLDRMCDLHRRACAGDNHVACMNLGALLAQRTCPGTAAEAVDVLRRACENGVTGACNNLGMIYRDGALGTPVDRERAVTAFRRACSERAVACDSLGALLLDTDTVGAMAALGAGCDLEPADERADASICCFKLGLMHENGWGIPVDESRAAAFHARACQGSVGPACHQLGLMELASSEPERKARAAAHFQEACSHGEARSCETLGRMYVLGDGVRRDVEHGVMLLRMACEGGVSAACARRPR